MAAFRTAWQHSLTPYKFRNLKAAVQSVKSSPGTLKSLSVLNTTGASAYVQIFNAQSGSGATVTFTVNNGAIDTVTATPAAGGTGYPISSTFNLPVTGGGGTGGLVQATTNGSGVITAFATTPVAGGTGYSATTGAATTGVTLGTTTPDNELLIAAGAQKDLILPPEGQGFNVAIAIASTTGEGGGSASADGVMVWANYS